MDPAAGFPPALRDRPFRVRAALAEGASWGVVRDLSNPFHGVRTTAPPPERLVDRALALQTVFRPGEVFSHLTAARLLGMRVPEGRSERRLDVTMIGDKRAMRRPGVNGHVARTPRRTIRTGAGLLVTDPVETWVDLAMEAAVDELVAIADGLIARRDPMATWSELEAAARSGRPRSAALREALAWARPGTDSWRETMLRLALVRRGLPEPEINGPIHDGAGRVIAHGDLVWRSERTVVEYEGRQHWDDEHQFSIDIGRINRITALGWRHIRVDKVLLAAPDALAADVLDALASRRVA
ncbi:MAG: hypothetical protein J7480_08005 [Microbacteriaceae bacterium]|nr:hypothetical protein [Microbacteriaceae bacterium]